MLEQNWSIIFASLIDWYTFNARNLPWRTHPDPYKIWLSEIIMQQTRIEQGLPYYNAFISKYPSVQSLALAQDDEILALWQGLGYYTRAHNLIKTARIIASQYNGHMPANFNQLIELPGIGHYTAAAIASIAFNKPFECVDGNVKRIMARITAFDVSVDLPDTIATFRSILSFWISQFNPSDFNQALMEFGALHCVPSNPNCANCPVNKHCSGFLTGNPTRFPIRNSPIVKKQRFLHYFYIPNSSNNNEAQYYILKRTMKDIWKGMYELPCIETSSEVDNETLTKSNQFSDLFGSHQISLKLLTKRKHTLTHQFINASLYRLELTIDSDSIPKSWILVNPNLIENFPVHRLMKHHLDDIAALDKA